MTREEATPFLWEVMELCDFGKGGLEIDMPAVRMDGEYAPITFLINCNDAFWWATADCEALTPENIHIMRESIADMEKVDGFHPELLFCARVRGMRPQSPYYKYFKPEEAKLFDACGPERTRESGG